MTVITYIIGNATITITKVAIISGVGVVRYPNMTHYDCNLTIANKTISVMERNNSDENVAIGKVINAINTANTNGNKFGDVENVINLISTPAIVYNVENIHNRRAKVTDFQIPLYLTKEFLILLQNAFKQYYTGKPEDLPLTKGIKLAIMNGKFPLPLTRVIAYLGNPEIDIYHRLCEQGIKIANKWKTILENFYPKRLSENVDLINFFENLQKTQHSAAPTLSTLPGSSSSSSSSSSSASSSSSSSEPLPSFGCGSTGGLALTTPLVLSSQIKALEESLLSSLPTPNPGS